MKKNSTLTQERFDNLLEWLSADREEAGVKYEKIRKGVIRFFRVRDCADPVALTDETLNRVADKLPGEKTDREKIPLKYIYGFAINVYREYERISSKIEIQLDQNLPLDALVSQNFPDNKSDDIICLEQCLKNFPSEDGEMMLEYYGQDKSVKLEFRRHMAENKNITVQALHTRIHRTKNNLKKCIEKCMDEKNL